MEPSVPEIHSFLHLSRALFFEFFGTALMVYAYNFTAASYMGRGFAYFIGWMIAVSISGAHFNPATTLAVYLAEGKYLRQIGRLILYILVQFAGGFMGIFFSWLVLKSPVMGYLMWPHIQDPSVAIWYFSDLGNIYYAKIVFLEILNTMTFLIIYLLVIYKPSLRTVDEIIKGFGVSIALWICYALSAGSGACLNPALALAQTAYQVGFLNGMG